ncbi:MATE family efflux transporter [Halalkalibacter flavus]|uniref:MATE family efflux transporter n=1 Tax=Halalkalibacter flavus TaxID=3090668 RepID=UPI002FC97059
MDKTKIGKLSIYAVTWPIFIEMGLQMLMRVTDVFMLSHVSDEAVASVGVSNQIIKSAIIMFTFVAVGSSIVITQYLGAKRTSEIGRIVGLALGINLLFGLFISILSVLFNRRLLSVFNLESELLEMAQTYLYITGGALVVQALLTVTVAIIQAHGFTRHTMLVAIGMNMLNIIGNYLFIFGSLGFPKIGVTGVAIATVVSQLIGLTANLIILRKVVAVRLKWRNFVRWQRDHVAKVLQVGVPSAAVSLSYHVNQFVITVFITSLSAITLTTHIYTQNIILIVMIMGLSLGRGMQIIVGHLVGEKKQEEAYIQVMRHLLRCILITLLSVSILCLFRAPLLELFTDSSQIIQIGSILILFSFLLEPGRNFNVILERSLQASGDARFAMFSSILITWLFSLPLTYLLGIHLGYGLFGIWAAFIIDEWIRGLVLFFRWRSKDWQKKALVQKKADSISV